MIKAECERVIRQLCHEWRKANGLTETPAEKLSFEQFYMWLKDNHSRYLAFRTTTSVRYDVEMWFDQELGQTSRR